MIEVELKTQEHFTFGVFFGPTYALYTVKAPNSGFFGHREIVHYWELVHYWERNNLVVNLGYIFSNPIYF